MDDSRAEDQVGEVAGAASALLGQVALLAQLQHQLAQRPGALGRGQPSVHRPARNTRTHQARSGVSRQEDGGEDQHQDGGLGTHEIGGMHRTHTNDLWGSKWPVS